MLLNINNHLLSRIFNFLNIKDSLQSSCFISKYITNLFKNKREIIRKDLYIFEYIYPQDNTYCKYFLYGKATHFLIEFIYLHNMKLLLSSNPRVYIPFYSRISGECYFIVLNKLLSEDINFKQSLSFYIQDKNILLSAHFSNF